MNQSRSPTGAVSYARAVCARALFNLIILLHLQCHFHLAEAEAALQREAHEC